MGCIVQNDIQDFGGAAPGIHLRRPVGDAIIEFVRAEVAANGDGGERDDKNRRRAKGMDGAEGPSRVGHDQCKPMQSKPKLVHNNRNRCKFNAANGPGHVLCVCTIHESID
jgi:hypothetical protein